MNMFFFLLLALTFLFVLSKIQSGKVYQPSCEIRVLSITTVMHSMYKMRLLLGVNKGGGKVTIK